MYGSLANETIIIGQGLIHELKKRMNMQNMKGGKGGGEEGNTKKSRYIDLSLQRERCSYCSLCPSCNKVKVQDPLTSMKSKCYNGVH